MIEILIIFIQQMEVRIVTNFKYALNIIIIYRNSWYKIAYKYTLMIITLPLDHANNI